MTIQKMNEIDKKTQPTLQYKLTHQGLIVFFCVIGALVAAICLLMSIDEQRFEGLAIVLFVLAGLVMLSYLVAMVFVRKKVLENPEIKDGAKHPARIPISAARYQALRKRIAKSILEKGNLDAYRFFFADQLMNGDLQPALVVSEAPFEIAVYSEAFDGALLLAFPDCLAEHADLHKGDRLVATVCYFSKAFARQGLQMDIFPGPRQTGTWQDLLPVIPAFFSADPALPGEKINELDAALWARAEARIAQHIAAFPESARDGFWFTHLSAEDSDRNPIYEAQR